MKKIVLLIAVAMCSTLAFSQAKKPELMVVPSDVWCQQNGFTTTYDNEGTPTVMCDYERALQNSSDLKLAIATINELMADRGFPLQSLEQSLKNVHAETAEELVITSKNGNAVAESPLERLWRTAKADIILELTWTVSQQGPKNTVTYTLEAIDPYTGRAIGGGVPFTGAPSMSADLGVLIREAALANIDAFNDRLQAYFDDMFTNGREVKIVFNVFEDNEAGIDLTTEFGEDQDELIDIINHWFKKNAVQGRFNKQGSTDYKATFNYVRIPLYDSEGDAMTGEDFAKQLTKMLKKAPYNIPSKVVSKGLGEVRIILGEK